MASEVRTNSSRAATTQQEATTGRKAFWWLACNGPTCAASPRALYPEDVEVLPVPEQLLGYASRADQLLVQKFLLTASEEMLTFYVTGRLDHPPRPQAYMQVPEEIVETPQKYTAWVTRRHGPA